MARLPDPEKKHLLGCCPDFRGGQSLELHLPDISRHWYIHVEKNTLFPKLISTRHTLQCTSKLSNCIMKKLKTSKRYVRIRKACKQDKINDSDQSSLAVTSRDKWRWQTSTCVWHHVCHLRCSMLTSRENIPVQMELMSEYIFLYDPLLNCLWQPSRLMACGLTNWWINNIENAL